VFVELEIPLPHKCHRWHLGECSSDECDKEEECLHTVSSLYYPPTAEASAQPRESFWSRKLQESDDKNRIGIYPAVQSSMQQQ
jgi:hypothetical protein